MKRSDEGEEIEIDYEIANVVATARLDTLPEGERVDLVEVAKRCLEVEYNPERFPGLVMRVEDPKGTLLIFTTGKAVVTGLKRSEQAVPAVERAIEKLGEVGVEVVDFEVKIENFVASGDLHTRVDLNMGAIVMERAMYEPEVFPGLIYRMRDPEVVFLVFSTGAFVATGTRDEESIHRGIVKLNGEIREMGLTVDPSGRTAEPLNFV